MRRQPDIGRFELKFLRGRRVYAYLRYQTGGKTVDRYTSEAPGSDREEPLRLAWSKGAVKRPTWSGGPRRRPGDLLVLRGEAA